MVHTALLAIEGLTAVFQEFKAGYPRDAEYQDFIKWQSNLVSSMVISPLEDVQ